MGKKLDDSVGYLSCTFQIIPDRPREFKDTPILAWDATRVVMFKEMDEEDILEAASDNPTKFLRWWEYWDKDDEEGLL